jgi:hypothetical protein
MKWYTLSNAAKYGINEIQYFKNSDGIMFKIDTNWKNGSMSVAIDDTVDISDIDTTETIETYSAFEEAYIDAVFDGTDEYEFIDTKTLEVIAQTDAHLKFIEGYEDDGVNFLYARGYDDELDPEVFITGGFTLDEGPCPYEF